MWARQKIPPEALPIVKLPMAYSGRFVADEGVNGVCKLLLGSDDTVLGAHVLGNPASEIITLAGMAIELKLTADEWKKDCLSAPHGGRDIQGGIVEPMTIVSYKHKR